MKALSSKLFAVSVALVLIGVVTIFLQPGGPEAECVPDGAPSSGFVDEESGCAISAESFDEISDYNSSPKPFRIVGLLLIVAGVVVAVVATVRRVRSSGSGSSA